MSPQSNGGASGFHDIIADTTHMTWSEEKTNVHPHTSPFILLLLLDPSLQFVYFLDFASPSSSNYSKPTHPLN